MAVVYTEHMFLAILVFGILFVRALAINYMRKLCLFLILFCLEIGLQFRDASSVFMKLTLNKILLFLLLDTHAFLK